MKPRDLNLRDGKKKLDCCLLQGLSDEFKGVPPYGVTELLFLHPFVCRRVFFVIMRWVLDLESKINDWTCDGKNECSFFERRLIYTRTNLITSGTLHERSKDWAYGIGHCYLMKLIILRKKKMDVYVITSLLAPSDRLKN